jgi:hypothetical protein
MPNGVRRIAVVGSRTYPVPARIFELFAFDDKAAALAVGRKIVEEFVEKLNPLTTILVSGGATGVDTWAADKAREMGMRVVEIRANWKKHGRGAGFKRNGEIVLASDDVACFWDGESRGAIDTVKKAAKQTKPHALFGPDGELTTAAL